jgi:hypothetical protein
LNLERLALKYKPDIQVKDRDYEQGQPELPPFLKFRLPSFGPTKPSPDACELVADLQNRLEFGDKDRGNDKS